MDKTNLVRLDKNKIIDNHDDIYVLAMMRNELLRLPYWLEYYREQGINSFYIIDNGSTDGTTEYLLEQTDCIVFQTYDSYKEAKSGIKWLNQIGQEFCMGHWCIIADVDELFVFPKKFGTTICEFTKAVEAEKADAVFTLMIDMYSRQPMSEVKYISGTPFTDICDSFDSKPYVSIQVKEFPYINVLGGIRQRLFFPSFSRRNIIDRLGWKIGNLSKALGIFNESFLIKKISYQRPPAISKVPLIKWSEGFELISSAHTTTTKTLFSGRCALLHFKFFDDFYTRSLEAVKRKMHFNGASEYAAYAKLLEKNPHISMESKNSMTYKNQDTLEDLGIITISGDPLDVRGLS